jgi:tetratricopeptide (TPR) repeat protein
MGRCHRKLGDIPYAIAEFDRAIAANALYVHAYQERGMCYWDSGKTEEAIKEFEPAITISPNNPIRYEIIAEILFKAEKYEQAERYLMRAISPERYNLALKINPSDVKVLFNKALCLTKQNEFDRAQKAYELILRIDSRYTKATAKLAELHKLRSAAAALAEAAKSKNKAS